jgi:hypothetical protein
VPDMRQGPYPGARHQMQAATNGGGVVIVGAGEQAALTFEYFTYDSVHEVIAFSAKPDFITTEVFCGLPVVPFDKLAVEYPPTECQAFVAVSATTPARQRQDQPETGRGEHRRQRRHRCYECLTCGARTAARYGRPQSIAGRLGADAAIPPPGSGQPPADQMHVPASA